MTRLLLLVEGQSEEIFVNQTLKPHLLSFGVHVQPPIVLWTKRHPAGGGFRGGVSSWRQILSSLLPLLEDSDAWVTTMLDFYGLPDDVPGYAAAREPGDPYVRAAGLHDALHANVRRPRFIPFLVLHEFEAWAFCSPEIVAAHFDQTNLATKMHRVLEQVESPELINHGKHTHPKARLQDMVQSYKETSDGPLLLQKIGIPAIRAQCPHFAGWLKRLESLGVAGSAQTQ
jgi:hypothetical protein